MGTDVALVLLLRRAEAGPYHPDPAGNRSRTPPLRVDFPGRGYPKRGFPKHVEFTAMEKDGQG